MRHLIGCILLLFPALLTAQDSDLGNWLIYIGGKDLGKGYNLHHEAQYRNYNAIGDLEQLLLRTGVGYNLTDNNNNVLLGYGYILSKNYTGMGDDKTTVEEHRIFQQFITKQRFGRVSWQHRYRIEQRWIEEDFRTRFRYFLSTNVTLNTPEMTDGSVYLSAYNEIFINGEQQLFDRNRVYAGLGYRLNPSVRLELAYMAQLFQGRSRDQINVLVLANF